MIKERPHPQEITGQGDDTTYANEVTPFRFSDLPKEIAETFAGAVVVIDENGLATIRVLNYTQKPGYDIVVNYVAPNPMPVSLLGKRYHELLGADEMRACDKPQRNENIQTVQCNIGGGGNDNNEVPVTLFLRPGHDQDENLWYHSTVNVVGTPDYPIWLQKGVDIGAGGILGFTLLGLVALGARLVQSKISEKRISKQRAQLLADLNNPNFSFTQEGGGSLASMKRMLGTQPYNRRDLLGQAILFKETLADITLAQVEARRREEELNKKQEYNPKLLQDFIATFNDQNTEVLTANGLGGLAQERDAVGRALLEELDHYIPDYIAPSVNEKTSQLQVNRNLIKDPELYKLLLSLYTSGDDSWFRKMNRSNQSGENRDVRCALLNLSDESIERLLIIHAEANGKLQESWDEIYDAMKKRCPKDKESMGFESAQEFLDTIELV